MIAIFGSSGFAKEVYLILVRLFSINVRVECFVCSDRDFVQGENIKGIPIVCEKDFFRDNNNQCIEAYIAVGSPHIKKKIVDKIESHCANVVFPNIIDPSVSIDPSHKFINIGRGVIICAGATLTIDIDLDDFSHINPNATIGHDATIGKFTTVSPGVNISGKVRIGKMAFLGTGSAILENLSITDNSIIGAGAVVVHDIREPGTYVGIPAKKIK